MAAIERPKVVNVRRGLKLMRIGYAERHELYPLFERVFGMDFLEFESQLDNLCTFHVLVNRYLDVCGFYVLKPRAIECYVPWARGWTGKGVQGVCLALDRSYRGYGWGQKLIDLPKSLGYDYVWGLHMRELNNLQYWLKRRQLVAEYPQMYVTATRL